MTRQRPTFEMIVRRQGKDLGVVGVLMSPVALAPEARDVAIGVVQFGDGEGRGEFSLAMNPTVRNADFLELDEGDDANQILQQPVWVEIDERTAPVLLRQNQNFPGEEGFRYVLIGAWRGVQIPGLDESTALDGAKYTGEFDHTRMAITGVCRDQSLQGDVAFRGHPLGGLLTQPVWGPEEARYALNTSSSTRWFEQHLALKTRQVNGETITLEEAGNLDYYAVMASENNPEYKQFLQECHQRGVSPNRRLQLVEPDQRERDAKIAQSAMVEITRARRAQLHGEEPGLG